MRNHPVPMLAALLLLAGCASNAEDATERSVWVADGPPTNCITKSQIRRTRVIDDRTIDFEMTGRTVYRNALPLRCSGLSFNQSIQTNSRGAWLCSSNTITPRSAVGGGRAPSCQLGQFQPITRTRVPVAPPAG